MPDAGNPDVNGISQAGVGGVPEVGGDSYEHESAADREALRQSQRRNLTLSLLAAGLGTLASRPPRGYKADGWRAAAEGGLAGLETYGQGEDRIAQEQLKRQALRGQQQYRMGELDYRNRSLESLDALRKLEVQHWGQQDKTKQEADAENARHHQADEGLRGQQIGVEQARAGTEAARLGSQDAPIGAEVATSILKAYNVPNADDAGKALGVLPRAAAMTNINAAVAATRQKKNIHFQTTKEGIYKITTDTEDGRTLSKEFIGEAPPKAGQRVNISYQKLADGVHKVVADPASGKTLSDDIIGQEMPTGANNVHYAAMGDGQLHRITTDPRTGKTVSDQALGKAAATKGGSTLADEAARIDASLKPTPAVPAATPSAAATATATPAPAATPAVTKIPAKPTATAARRTYKGKPGWYDPSTHNFYPDA